MGALSGAIYGAAAELTPLARAGYWALFGAALWAIADEIAAPALGLSESPDKLPWKSHAQYLGAHLVYGIVTNAVRQGVAKLVA